MHKDIALWIKSHTDDSEIEGEHTQRPTPDGSTAMEQKGVYQKADHPFLHKFYLAIGALVLLLDFLSTEVSRCQPGEVEGLRCDEER